MENYLVQCDVYGLPDGRRLGSGATVFADELTPGRIAAGLRLGHLTPGGDREKPADPSASAVPLAPVPSHNADDPTELEEQHAATPLPVAAAVGDPLDAAIGTLAGCDAEALARLAAAELLCIGDALDYLTEHGSFLGLEGIGKGRDKQLRAALAPYLPAGESN